jgi:hypothetical protein
MKTRGEIAADEKAGDEDEKLFSSFTSFLIHYLKLPIAVAPYLATPCTVEPSCVSSR